MARSDISRFAVTDGVSSDLYQMLNGWILGKTGYTLGSVGNLDSVRASASLAK